MTKIALVDLFSGIGGFAEGLRRAVLTLVLEKPQTGDIPDIIA